MLPTCILRGGGSNIDLACFNDYNLCAHVAESALPVLSGIGHERDTSIVDMVAHTRLKTPTAVAEFIISHNLNFETRIATVFNDIKNKAYDTLQQQYNFLESVSYSVSHRPLQQLTNEQYQLQRMAFLLKAAGNKSLRKERKHLPIQHVRLQLSCQNLTKQMQRKIDEQYKTKLLHTSEQVLLHAKAKQTAVATQLLDTKTHLQNQKAHLDWIQQILQMSDPQQWLSKGLALIRHKGKIISSAEDLHPKQLLDIELKDGFVQTKVNLIKKK